MNTLGLPELRGAGVRRLVLHVTQLGQWNMTANRMAELRGPPRWCLIVTDVADTSGAPALERATPRRWIEVHRILSGQSRFGVRIGLQHRAEQHFGVGVGGKAIDVFSRTRLAESALVEHRHAIGHGTHHRQVMRDKNIGCPMIGLELGQQVQDGGLNRNIECRRHLIAQH